MYQDIVLYTTTISLIHVYDTIIYVYFCVYVCKYICFIFYERK